MITETSSLIAHVIAGERYDDAKLRKMLNLSDKRYAALKAGEEHATRTQLAALGVLAGRVGYTDMITPDAAKHIRPGNVVLFANVEWIVLSDRKSGPNAPYFTLLGDDDSIAYNVSYRLLRFPNPKGAHDADATAATARKK